MLLQISNGLSYALSESVLIKVGFALATIFVGIIIARLGGRIVRGVSSRINVDNPALVNNSAKLVELLIFIGSLVLALLFLQADAAEIIITSVVGLVPSIVTLLLLVFLGYILVQLIVDILKAAFLRTGLEEYLEQIDISKSLVDGLFRIIKIFLFLIVLSVSFNYVNIPVPFVTEFITVFAIALIVFIGALLFLSLREQIENFFAGLDIQHNILKLGQTVKIEGDLGEVKAFSPHGTLIKLNTGYNLLIPNKELVKKKIYIRRTRQEIAKLEQVREHFIAQLQSYCGPASAAMMLSLFGHRVSQEELGKLANTRANVGTVPKKLIKAVSVKSNGTVKGALIRYRDISNLRNEIKSWIAEGALVLLWFHKPTIFEEAKTGHYVLCVGVEGDELIIIDPSLQTGGVYLVDYRLLDEAMSEKDKERGYIVFAKKGSSAYWRISEKLLYADLSSYSDLSKSFERYLIKMVRRNKVVNDLLSEHVFKIVEPRGKKIDRVWSPSVGKKA